MYKRVKGTGRIPPQFARRGIRSERKKKDPPKKQSRKELFILNDRLDANGDNNTGPKIENN